MIITFGIPSVEGHDHSDKAPVWKGSVALVAIIAFLVFEKLIQKVSKWRQGKKVKSLKEGPEYDKGTDKIANSEEVEGTPDAVKVAISMDQHSHSHQNLDSISSVGRQILQTTISITNQTK